MLEKFNDIVGQICIDVKRNDKHLHEDEIHFTLENGDRYALAHSQDCCESVVIESIEGDLKDLVGSPIVMADESSKEDAYSKWTFYRLATIKGYVDIRFLGETDSCYSIDVDFVKL
jgi:hypothetical protein